MLRTVCKDTVRPVLIGLVIILAFIFLLPQAKILANFATPTIASADEERGELLTENNKVIHLPNNNIKILRTAKVTITAYNAVPEQTDDTPCITADGTNVCLKSDINIIAANWLPFGAQVRIPEVFGDTIFEVHDRMNQRYTNRIDVLMNSVPQAKQFGLQQLEVEILSTI